MGPSETRDRLGGIGGGRIGWGLKTIKERKKGSEQRREMEKEFAVNERGRVREREREREKEKGLSI